MQRRRHPFRPKPCLKCGFRLSRARLKGYCIQCARIVGILPRSKYTPKNVLEDAVLIPADRLQPRPPILRVIDGQEYEIVWDGQ